MLAELAQLPPDATPVPPDPAAWLTAETTGDLSPAMLRVMLFYGGLLIAGLLADLVLLARSETRPPLRDPARAARLTGRPIEELWFLLLALAAILAQPLGWWLSQRMAHYGAALMVLAQSLVFHGLIIAATAVYLWRRRLGAGAAFGLEPSLRATAIRLGQAGWGYLAVLPPLLGAAVIGYGILRAAGVEAEPQDVAKILCRAGDGWSRVIFVCVAAGLAPLGEELLFRGIALPVLARRFGPGTALVVTALIFAALHGNAMALFPLFILGLALGWAYWLTGSLLVPIAMHAIFNAVNSVLLMTASGGQ